MGTDIHLFVEYMIGPADRRTWVSLTAGEFQLARDYGLFGALARVREGKPKIPERGFPGDASDDAARWYFQIVDDTDANDGLWQHVTRAAADDHVAKGISTRQLWRDMEVISDPDAHHPGWLDRSEFMAAVDATPGARESHIALGAVVAALEALPSDALPRVVFWFDN